MKPECRFFNNLYEIDSIYLDEVYGFVKKEKIHNYLLEYPNSINLHSLPRC